MATMRRLLIANRGEISVRIQRTAREMGISTVAVASEADANALHARIADHCVVLNGSTPAESYLDVDQILAAARETGADAIHPGYGFLSERPSFVEAVEAAGLTFVGPTAFAMRMLGSKRDAKEVAEKAGVPIVPGYFAPLASDADLLAAADKMGYPVMLKASAGGGGRGMRPAFSREELEEALPVARQEALGGFGDDEMIVEKLVLNPRHVEIQVIADNHGGALALYERECSVQRRRQKLTEESPAHGLPLEVRTQMEEAALALVRATGYRNAGTVEFIVDPVTNEFFFLEVNARLQVEHPVTESVTGLDLVRLQLEVAQGLVLPLVRPASQGHALELRILAEDPAAGFLPSLGKILAWMEPKGPGIRVDAGFGEGDEISRFYDSLLAKLIVSGPDRASTLARARRALMDFHILGVKTNIAYLLDLLSHPDFVSGAVHTGWLEEAQVIREHAVPIELGALLGFAGAVASGSVVEAAGSFWSEADGFRNVK